MELVGAASGQSSGQVWIENHPTEGWTPGRVDSLAGNGNYIVVDETGESHEVPQDKARPVDQACLRGVDDLLDLGDFNEGALLHNIRVRYFKDDIYTGIGGPILISVNPFAALPGLYAEAKQKYYRERAQAMIAGDVKLSPHVYSVGAASYMSMLSDSKNQSIIISGESGAGKTEATKRILTYFASLQTDTKKEPGEISIEQQVLRSNPILEAFGNAKTLRNDNSSRFGKFMEIEFGTAGGIQSARVSNYLLEKCRIVTQTKGERGYHSFYQLIAGADTIGLAPLLKLKSADDYTYVCGTTWVDGEDDNQNFAEMVECMHTLGFSTDERNSIFQIVAAVLHLGDLSFEPLPGQNDGMKISDQARAEDISKLLEVDVKAFTKVFQYKTLEDPFTKKVIDMPQDELGSSNTRHSMAKVAYSRLFDWLVQRINESMKSKSKGGGTTNTRKIGILDIYGFEVFEWNSFEQLCINFANEKLQQHFNSHMFTMEQQMYSEEGIAWSHIQFVDNREIIDTLEKKPLGLFCIFDSECLMPNATDNTCLSKVHATYKTSKIVYKPSRFASTTFAVAHYAGEVIYDIVSFLEKNTDKLHSDIMNLLKTSSNALIKSLFIDPRFAPEMATGAAAGGKGAAKAGARPAGGRGGGDAGGARAKQNVTVSLNFRQQLDQLVEDLNKTHPRYVRCIKPNANKAAHDFDSLDVQRQLRCAGMLESIRIRRAGYSVRRPFKEFVNRFRVLMPSLKTSGMDPDYKDISRKLLTEMEAKIRAEKVEKLEDKPWQIGRSKVFMKEELQTMLEKRIGTAVAKFVIKIQKRWRGFKLRKRFKEMKKAGLALQAGLRTAKLMAEYQIHRDRVRACVALQAALRTAALRREWTRKRTSALKIQKVVRGWRGRRKMGKLKGKNAQDRIQKMREEEARDSALADAKKAAQEKEREMDAMKQQMEQERQKAQEEAQAQFAAQREEMDRTARNMQVQAQAKQAEEVDGQQLQKAKQEALELRKENARLQGQLEVTGPGSPGAAADSANDAEVEHLRRELQDSRRKCASMEVELATAKNPAEYEALSTEVSTIREECSSLRRTKMDVELQLERQTVHLDDLQSQASRLKERELELDVLRSANDESQVTIQKLQAQKGALEERAQGEEATRAALRELKMAHMQMEGELETSKLREEAMSQKFKSLSTDQTELLQTKHKLVMQESDLDTSRRQVMSLREQVDALNSKAGSNRNGSLDDLRTELLSRIEAKPVQVDRPSIVFPGAADGGFVTEERKTLCDQRALFEQLKNDFNQSRAGGMTIDVQQIEEAETQILSRESELEEEVRMVRKENVELNIKITSMKDEYMALEAEVTEHRGGSGQMRAELEDLKFQLTSEASESRRKAAEAEEVLSRSREVQSELSASRQRLSSAEEKLVRTEEEARTVTQRYGALQREQEASDLRMQELQRKYVEAEARVRDVQPQLEDEQRKAEQLRKMLETAERGRAEGESSSRFLESENERLRAELTDSQAEKLKIKEVVDELLSAEGAAKSAEMQKEVDKWKTRAGYFEREYSRSKELNHEMTGQMAQMLQGVREQSETGGGLSSDNKTLKKQLDAKTQEARMAKLEKEDIQRQLDSLSSTGTYFQDQYKNASQELRNVKQEHSVSSASASTMKARLESLQSENDDLKAQVTKLSIEVRSGCSEALRLDKYEQHVQDLQKKLQAKDLEAQTNQERFQKSQAVNDCLNTLLVLESEQASLWESSYPGQPDDRFKSQLNAKKSKAQDVIGRLNDMLNEDERPSIAGFATPRQNGAGRGGYDDGGGDIDQSRRMLTPADLDTGRGSFGFGFR